MSNEPDDVLSETVAMNFQQVRCPHCRRELDISRDGSPADLHCPHCGGSFGMLGNSPVIKPDQHRAPEPQRGGGLTTCLIVSLVIGLFALMVGGLAFFGLIFALRMEPAPIPPQPVVVEEWAEDVEFLPPEPVEPPTVDTGKLPVREFPSPSTDPFAPSSTDPSASPSTDPFALPPHTETVGSVAAREEETIQSRFPTARKLVETAFGADWSPDGREVVYGRRSGGIVVLDLDSSEEQVLSETGKDPRWSPGDGQYITFVEGRSQEETVWVVEASGGTPRKVADGGYPNWSADGKRIYYREFTSRGMVKSVSVDDPDEEPQTIYDAGSVSFYPAVSPDGSRLVVQRSDQVVVIGLDDPAQPEELFTFPIPDWRGFLPAWSRDGSRISYGTFGQDDGKGLWAVDLSQDEPEPAQLLEGQFTMGLWSPDGQRMLIDHRTRVDWNIWIVALDSSEP